MKCHWCDKELVNRIFYDDGKKKVMRNYYECTEAHAELYLQDGKINTFIFFFFIDDEGTRRYRIERYADGRTALYIRTMGKGGYKHIFDLTSPVEVEIVDDVPQVKRLYERMKKLAIFS